MIKKESESQVASSTEWLKQVEDSPYIKAAKSDNTRRAYQSDIEHFLSMVGKLPATPQMVKAYLETCAATINPRTLRRRLVALRQWHRLQGFDDPTHNPLVTTLMTGIERTHGQPPKQSAALLLKDVDQIVKHLNASPTLANSRNRAMLLVGFFGAFRSSELTGLMVEHIQFVKEGMVIQLRRSKTDQAGKGASVAIPFGDDLRCPVRALLDWLHKSGLQSGPVFRQIYNSGKLNTKAINAPSWNRLLKKLAHEAGLRHADQISSHSLRRGFASETDRLGASIAAIKHHGRWKSVKTLMGYIETGRQFTDSAVNLLYDF